MTSNQFLAIRKKAGLSQVEFGKKIGLVGTSVTAIEKGRNPVTNQTLFLIQFTFPEEYLAVCGKKIEKSLT